MRNLAMVWFRLALCLLILIGFVFSGGSANGISEQTQPLDIETESTSEQGGNQESTDAPGSDFEKRLRSLRWISFAPTNWDPEKGVQPSLQSLKDDLKILHRAGFNAIVTYGANVLEPETAEQMGFRGMIFGVWDPQDRDEMERAKSAFESDIVIGFSIGNEGLDVRYDFQTLKGAIDELRAATGRPVTTSEQIEDYQDQSLLTLGDWIFPIVHPYWHNVCDPEDAVEWTELQYRHLTVKAPNHTVFLKEVGLPSGGGPGLSEASQAEYYRRLQGTDIFFCWFESYDQPWKGRSHSVESYWGIFRSDRSPKAAANIIAQ